jgi:hypothetical protein
MLPARRTSVFVVTLLIDGEAGAELRGRVRCVSDDQDLPFTSGADLLRLLQPARVAEPVQRAASVPPPFPSADEADPPT